MSERRWRLNLKFGILFLHLVIMFQMRKQTVGVCSLQMCQHQNKIGKIPVLFMQLPRLRVTRTEGCRSCLGTGPCATRGLPFLEYHCKHTNLKLGGYMLREEKGGRKSVIFWRGRALCTFPFPLLAKKTFLKDSRARLKVSSIRMI